MEVTLDDSIWEDVDPGTEALVERWLVPSGTRVTKGQPIAEVVVVKANYEVVAAATGTLSRILVDAEGTFGRGVPIAYIETET